MGAEQGCQMVYFQTKNPNLGKFWRLMQWNMLVYFMSIWYILRQIGRFLWPMGRFSGILVYFFRFGNVVARKIWQSRFRSHSIKHFGVAIAIIYFSTVAI
jgi:hypothetical protein